MDAASNRDLCEPEAGVAMGRVMWIGLAGETLGPIQEVASTWARVDQGLDGDHHAKQRPGGDRQVTLIQTEHLAEVSNRMGLAAVHPSQVRRNVLVSGLELLSLAGRRFRIGQAILEFTGPCKPCSLMETNLGPGGLTAMLGLGGITARVLTAGEIRVGDTVSVDV